MSCKDSTMIRGDIQSIHEEIQRVLRQLGFLDVRYPDNRNGTAEEIAVRKATFHEQLGKLKERRRWLCQKHARMDDGFRAVPGCYWCGLSMSQLVACGYKRMEEK